MLIETNCNSSKDRSNQIDIGCGKGSRNNNAGKGSKRRPTDEKSYRDNFDSIFRNNKDKKKAK